MDIGFLICLIPLIGIICIMFAFLAYPLAYMLLAVWIVLREMWTDFFKDLKNI